MDPIKVHPKDCEVVPGNSAVFTVTAAAGDNIEFKWRKDGNPLPDPKAAVNTEYKYKVEVKNNEKISIATLTISPVTMLHRGKYQCVVCYHRGDQGTLSDLAQLTLRKFINPRRACAGGLQ